MDRYPGYESMLTRVEHMKMQVKAQLPTEYSQTVDNMVDFVLDEVNQCWNVPTVDASTDTTEDHILSDGPVARADDTRIEVNEQTNEVHQHEGSISSGQTVSPVGPSLPPVTHSTIQTNIKVKDSSTVRSVQLDKFVKKEEDDDGEYVMECDCKECETCRVKREIKEELDESGFETGGNNGLSFQGCTRVKKEEEDGEFEIERPKKIQPMDRVVGNVPVGSQSSTVHSSNVISINVEYVDDQVATSSTNSLTIEDHTRPSQPVTIPLLTPIVTQTQSSSSSAQLVNETLRNELLNAEPRMDNVALVVDMGAAEFDREQIDGDNSTLNPVHIDQDDEEEDEGDEDETIEQREVLSDYDERQVQVTANNFVKRIEPADELGNKFECDYRGCGKRTKRKWDLVLHIRTHTGEMRFKCLVAGCVRAFVQKCHLDEHIRTHTGERPFICTWPHCGQAFISSSHLKIHSHVHSNERHVCDVTGCTKVYKSKVALRKHQKAKHN